MTSKKTTIKLLTVACLGQKNQLTGLACLFNKSLQNCRRFISTTIYFTNLIQTEICCHNMAAPIYATYTGPCWGSHKCQDSSAQIIRWCLEEAVIEHPWSLKIHNKQQMLGKYHSILLCLHRNYLCLILVVAGTIIISNVMGNSLQSQTGR